jgi:hypothetical protein
MGALKLAGTITRTEGGGICVRNVSIVCGLMPYSSANLIA